MTCDAILHDHKLISLELIGMYSVKFALFRIGKCSVITSSQ